MVGESEGAPEWGCPRAKYKSPLLLSEGVGWSIHSAGELSGCGGNSSRQLSLLERRVRGDVAGACPVVADDARLVGAEPALAALSDYRRESRRSIGYDHRRSSQVRNGKVITAL